MSVRRSAGTIFWGLTLVATGGLLLARNLGYTIPIGSYFIRYWPALLIAWGLLKFVDYYRFRTAGDNRPLFSAGEVAFLIFLIFAGSAITTASNVSPGIGNIFEIGDFDLWDITGNNFSYDEHREAAVPEGSSIDIINLFGNVEVRASDSDHVVLDVRKTIRAGNRDEADRLNNDFTFSISDEGGRYRIVSNRDDVTSNRVRFERQRYKSSMTIQVPKRAALHIDNRNGSVRIGDLTGNQNIINRYGDVEVQTISGDLTIDNRNGSVSVQDVTGPVKISNRYSNTSVKNAGSDLDIDTRNGSVDVAGVKGNATISNSYSPISVDNVQGSLTISGRNNSLELQHIEGDLRAESSYQNVNIGDARGSVSVNSRNGDLSLSFVKPPQKDVDISTRYGNVTIEIPANAAFSINAHTEYGEVNSEFDGISTNTSRHERSLSGRVGSGGPHITISAKNGSVHLNKRG